MVKPPAATGIPTDSVPGGGFRGPVPGITMCILCAGDEGELPGYLAEIGGFGAEIAVVCGVRGENGHGKEPPTSFPPADAGSGPAGALTDAVGKAAGEWILILRLGEQVSADQYRVISSLCGAGGGQAYRFIKPIELKRTDLSTYEWLGNQGKYSRPDVLRKGYVPRTEIRLFKKAVFREALAVDTDCLWLALDERAGTAVLCQDLLFPTEPEQPERDAPGDDALWKRDRERFLETGETVSEFTRSFELFGPGSIGYSLISEADVPSLEAGLELGFGRVEILKWAVHNLIEKGAYREALRFADRITDRLPAQAEGMYEIWHLKGIAAFHLLDIESAERAMHRALELNATDRHTLSDLARVYIVSGRVAEAGAVLERLIAHHGLTPDNEYIHAAVKHHDGRRPTLSLLILCRDEAPYIARVLNASKPLFDEIVAVDTGSEDGTVDILREQGVRVASYPWNDDFSEARNYGLTQVTGDYVFWMDGDEYLTDKDRLSLAVFKSLLPVNERTGLVFEVQTLNGDYDINTKGIPPVTTTRRTALFPNLAGVRFQGRVFESVDASLDAMGIPLLFAESISIKHHNRNETARSIRKIPAMQKSLADLAPEGLLQGVRFWLAVGDARLAIQWFVHAVGKARGRGRYLAAISELFTELKQGGHIRSNPQALRALVTHYGASYRVSTLCADYLYELGEYGGAVKLSQRLVFREDQQFIDQPEITDIRKNRLTFARASLELDDVHACDAVLTLLSGDHEAADAVRALSFYAAIRRRELDGAISLLDEWINAGNIPITGTLDNFTDFIRLIADVAEVMARYGRIDAAAILTRSADYFASTLGKGV